MARRLSISILIILLGASLSLGQWGQEIDLTPGSIGGSWTTANNARGLACRGDTIYLVWHDFRVSPRNYGCEIYFKYYDGSAWSADAVIGTFGVARYYFNWNPSCALDDQGRLHVVWESNGINAPNTSDFDIVYRSYYAGAWSAPVKLTNHPLYSWYPSLVCRSGGRLDVFWQDNRSGSFRIYHRYYDGSAWQTEACVDTMSLAAGYPSAALSQDRPAVAWQDFRSGTSQIFFRRLGPSGWEADSAVSHSSVGAYCPCLGTDEAGNLHLVWEDFQDGSSEIYYRRFHLATQSWGPITRVTYDPAHSRQPTLVCRGDSLVDIFWADDRDGNYEIYSVRVKNGLWGSEQRLTSQGSFSMGPAAAADHQGNLHLVWSDQRVAAGYAPDIYYNKYTVEPAGVHNPGDPGPDFSDLKIYPNPSSGPVNILFDLRPGALSRPIWLNIYNISGQLVLKKMLDAPAPGSKPSFLLGQVLGPGVYVACLSDGQYRLSQRFVILR